MLIFPGSGGDRAGEVVAKALAREHEVIGPEEWERAAGRLGETTGASRGEVARIAPELRARAVFSGNVAPRGAALSLSLIARDGKTGEVIDSARFRMRNYDFTPAVAKQVEAFTLRAAARGKAGEPTLPPQAPPPPAEVVSAPPPPPPPPPPHGSWESLFDAQLGVGVAGRWFAQGTPQDYGVFGVGAFEVRAEVWPLARRRGGLTSVGIGVGYGQAFSMTSNVEDSKFPGCDGLPTVMRHADAGLRARWNPSRSERGVTLRGQLGWGLRMFSIDGDGCPNFAGAVPDATHQMLRAGAGLRLPVGPERLTLQADLAYLHIMGDSGEIGGNGGNGWEVAAGPDWRVSARTKLGLRAAYTRIAVDAPAANLVESATDQYLSILAVGNLSL